MGALSAQRAVMPIRQLNGNNPSGLAAPSTENTPQKSTKSPSKASTSRSPSVDQSAMAQEDLEALPVKAKKEKRSEVQQQDFRARNNSAGLLGSTATKAAEGLKAGGRGFFNKLTRSGSSNERAGYSGPMPEEEYEPAVLKLPLIEQTRQTRIAKSYDHCRDKTEFWMPALPWRCIDYLNGKCEEEGLYRVSGGVTDIRKWRRRFDTEGDINLLDEPDLYDASVIASLFKEWIRELPEEIFPKSAQAKIAASLPADGQGPVPQALREELSNLPPFNYYLLFAITCHLSLLLSQESKNKMTLSNLYRCFNQSLKLDGRVFYTLVGDWRNCWQGKCYSEESYLRAEYEFLQTPFPVDHAEQDEHVIPPSSRSVRSITSDEQQVGVDGRPATSHTQPAYGVVDKTHDDGLLSPDRPQQRSSSDATGTSSMEVRNAVNSK